MGLCLSAVFISPTISSCGNCLSALSLSRAHFSVQRSSLSQLILSSLSVCLSLSPHLLIAHHLSLWKSSTSDFSLFSLSLSLSDCALYIALLSFAFFPLLTHLSEVVAEFAMVSASPEAIRELTLSLRQATAGDAQLSLAYKNLHKGYPEVVAERFLKARENNVSKTLKMILDCLHWRIDNDIDNILSKPIGPKETYDAIRESQPIGMTGFCKKGRPVFAVGVGLTGFDKAPVDKYIQSHIQLNEYRDQVLLPNSSKRMGHFVGTCLKILDMTNLKLSTLSRIKVLTLISTIDDLNYPEKTDTYYIVNTPYIFQACWKVVKPLLHERTKRKVRVLQGCGREELLKVMDADVLPHFCRLDSKHMHTEDAMAVDYFSPSHAFHVEVWSYIKQQSYVSKCVGPSPQKSFHVEVPQPKEETGSERESVGWVSSWVY